MVREKDAAAAPLRTIGAVLVLVGIVANEWVLGSVFAPDGVVTGAGKLFLIVFFQTFVLMSGIAAIYAASRIAGPVGFGWFVRAGVAVSAVAFASASVSMGLRAYLSSHSHTVEMHGAMVHEPTDAERRWSDELAARTLEASKRNGWFDFDEAMADGFEPMWKNPNHYPNREFLFDDDILDPDRPEYLMYFDTPEGKLLVGVMYYARTPTEKGPTLGGSLARWHYHPWAPKGRCAVKGLLPVGDPDENGNCAEGEKVLRSPEMLHVWFIEHPLGRFADAMVFPDPDGSLDVTSLHPFFVHFTMALFLVAVGLDVAGRWSGNQKYHSAAWINLVLAGGFAAASVAAGMAAEIHLLISPEAHATLTLHKKLGFAVAGCIAALSIWRATSKGRFPARGGLAYLAVALLGSGLTLATGYYGAQMVYSEGVAVKAVDRLALEQHKHRVFNEYLAAEAEGWESTAETHSTSGDGETDDHAARETIYRARGVQE